MRGILYGPGAGRAPRAMAILAANPPVGSSPEWLAGVVTLFAVSFGLAWLLRRAGLPGAAAVGGVAAGLVLGPGVLGRMAPQAHDRLFGGAPVERAAWREAERAVEATLFVAGSAEVDPAAAGSQIDALSAEADARRADWMAAVETARRPFALLAIALAAVLFLIVGATRASGSDADGGGWGSGLLLGAWNAALPAALAAVGLRWLGEPAWSPTMWAVMAAMAAGAWPLDRDERSIARQAAFGGEPAVRTAGLLASAVAVGLLGAASLGAAPAMNAFAALAVSLGIGVTLGRFFPGERWSARGIALLVPPLAALATLRIEPFLDVRWGLLILLALIADDGRWLGGMIGSWLPGGVSASRAMGLGLVAVSAGPAMLAITAVAIATGSLSPAAAAGLLAGAILIEVLAPARRRFAADLVAG